MRYADELFNRCVLILVGTRIGLSFMEDEDEDEGFGTVAGRLEDSSSNAVDGTSATDFDWYDKANAPNANRPHGTAGLCTDVIRTAALAGILPHWVCLAVPDKSALYF